MTALVVGSAKVSCILGAICLPILVIVIVVLAGLAISSAAVSGDAFEDTILGYFDSLQEILQE